MKKLSQITVITCLVMLLVPASVFTCTSFALNHNEYFIFGTNYDNSFAPGMIYVNKKHVRKSGWETCWLKKD